MLLVFIWLAFAVITAIAAGNKGRSTPGWFLIGLVFGVFGLIAALVVSDLPAAASDAARPVTGAIARLSETLPEAEPTGKTCPRCAEEVKPAASICRFCGHEFVPKNAEVSADK